tara:strand:- start:61 stop:1869 length:1809 start_codon:yes stop_codon:yes gene_type:complete
VKCLNCEKENPPSRGSKKRKYCSKKCANDFLKHERRKDHPRFNDPTWKRKTELRVASRAKHNQEVLAIQKNAEKNLWTIEKMAEELGITVGALHWRVNKTGIKKFLITCVCENVVTGRAVKLYLKPEDKEILLCKPKPIPDGCLTAPQVAKKIGRTPGTLEGLFQDYGTPNRTWTQQMPDDTSRSGSYVSRYIYKEEDIDEWWTNIQNIRNQKELERIQLKKKKQKEKLKEEQERKEKNRIKRKLRKKKEKREKQKRKEECILRREEKKQSLQRKTDWTTDENYEKSLKNKFANPTYQTQPRYVEGKKTNLFLWEEQDKGNIIEFMCKGCKKDLPFYKFHIANSSKERGRSGDCKECRCAATIRRRRSNKFKSKEEPSAKLRRQIGISIKQDLAKRNKKYIVISLKSIWNVLPYTPKELQVHLENQFTDGQSWESHTRVDLNESAWNIDHKKAKSTFEYTSIHDKSFLEAWSLANLCVLGAVTNVIKSNKTQRESFKSSFSHGLFSKRLKPYTRGIWKHLPYTVLEARQYFESQFIDGMTWENHGTDWHIDHIIPQAALPYNTVKHPNFIKCWALNNLQPLWAHTNNLKSSRYDGKKHYYKN